MLAQNDTKNINYARIVAMLRILLRENAITEKEYLHAKKYYQKLTGADIVLAD